MQITKSVGDVTISFDLATGTLKLEAPGKAEIAVPLTPENAVTLGGQIEAWGKSQKK